MLRSGRTAPPGENGRVADTGQAPPTQRGNTTVPSRELDFPVFDADNHMYETEDALTKFLPKEYSKALEYLEIKGRTKMVVRGTISEYIPNPTFEVVAAPGAQEEYYRHGNPDGKSYRELIGEPMKSIPAFRSAAPRLELMDEQGIDRALMFPTLASLIEERLKDDPEMIQAIVHSLNQWMYEAWQFNYEDRIFATPVIAMGLVDQALEELEWVIERGARAVLIRPAPVPTFRGTLSPACPSSTPSGSASRRPICWWACTPRTAATTRSPTGGRTPGSSCPSSPRPSGPWPRDAAPSTTPWPPWCATGPSPVSPA